MAPGDRLDDDDDDGVGLEVEVLVLLLMTPIPVPVRLGLRVELSPVLLPAAPPDEDGVPLSVTGASGGGVDGVVAGCAVETLELVLLVDGQVAVEGTVTPTERHCYHACYKYAWPRVVRVLRGGSSPPIILPGLLPDLLARS